MAAPSKGGRNVPVAEALDLVKGDVIECHIDGLPELSVRIVQCLSGRDDPRENT